MNGNGGRAPMLATHAGRDMAKLLSLQFGAANHPRVLIHLYANPVRTHCLVTNHLRT